MLEILTKPHGSGSVMFSYLHTHLVEDKACCVVKESIPLPAEVHNGILTFVSHCMEKPDAMSEMYIAELLQVDKERKGNMGNWDKAREKNSNVFVLHKSISNSYLTGKLMLSFPFESAELC